METRDATKTARPLATLALADARSRAIASFASPASSRMSVALSMNSSACAFVTYEAADAASLAATASGRASIAAVCSARRPLNDSSGRRPFP
jgi:hypothetical protein